MEGEGFEPSKAEPSDLQSDPFGRSGTPPRGIFLIVALEWWREKDSNLRRQSRQIYSLIPLAAREPLPKCEAHTNRSSLFVNPLKRFWQQKMTVRRFFDTSCSKFRLISKLCAAFLCSPVAGSGRKIQNLLRDRQKDRLTWRSFAELSLISGAMISAGTGRWTPVSGSGSVHPVRCETPAPRSDHGDRPGSGGHDSGDRPSHRGGRTGCR